MMVSFSLLTSPDNWRAINLLSGVVTKMPTPCLTSEDQDLSESSHPDYGTADPELFSHFPFGGQAVSGFDLALSMDF